MSRFSDLLDRAIVYVRQNPNITSDELARLLGVRYGAEAAFYRVKALQVLGLLPR